MGVALNRWLAITIALGVVAAHRVADAAPVGARDTATTREPGTWSVGIADPLRIGVAPGVELDAQVLAWLALSPNVGLRTELRRAGRWTVTGEYGLALPTMGLRLTQGYLLPSWEKGGGHVGWILVPRAGLAISADVPRGDLHDAFSVRLGSAVGVPLGHNDAAPLETYAPIEIITAPALRGFRQDTSATYDLALTSWLRGRATLDAWYVGRSLQTDTSPWILGAGIHMDARWGRLRFSLGAILFDQDQHRTVIEETADGPVRRRARTRELWPAFDLIWEPSSAH